MRKRRKLLDEPFASVPVEEPSQPRIEELDETQDDEVYLPPRVNLEGMTKEQIAALSMRHFGVRPDGKGLKEEQIAEVTRRMRAGRPSFM